jgi:hypothetical protein
MLSIKQSDYSDFKYTDPSFLERLETSFDKLNVYHFNHPVEVTVSLDLEKKDAFDEKEETK